MSYARHELFDGRASLTLAENLDADYSTELIRQFTCKRSAKGRLVSAWNHVEFGLNTSLPLDPDIRINYFDNALQLLGMVLSKGEAHPDTHLEALILSTYIPAFCKRALDIELDAGDCGDIYASLGSVFAYLHPFSENAVPSAISLETMVLALSARTRQPSLLLYPTSPREEA